MISASLPTAFGGLGERSMLNSVLGAEELAWGDLSGTVATLAPGAFALPVLLAGSEEQRRRWLPAFGRPEWPSLTAAWIEPTHDFDLGRPAVCAQRMSGGYQLSGTKGWVPYAPTADALLVFASCEGKLAGFLVPAGTEGMRTGEREKLLGFHALPLYRLQLDTVTVPEADRLGGADVDLTPVTVAARVIAAALALGVARAAFEYARDYAKERQAFGTPIAQRQAIAFMLAEMATELEAVRLLVWEAAWKSDQGKDSVRSAYLAYQGAAAMAMTVTDRAVQILGGHGYVRDHPVERWMREGRGAGAWAGLAVA
jgi:alkylation response protein AidB-like acyl-CoA dehydrogenase